MNRLLSASLLVVALPTVAAAQSSVTRPEIPAGTGGEEMLLEGVGVDETFDRPVPVDATFLDHEGRAVRLGDVVDGSRPVLLHFVYFSCAVICENAINALAGTLAAQVWTVGTEYDVVTISMDPHDGPAEAAIARGRVLGRYGRAEADTGWHFLTGTASEIARVTDAVGYHFRWDDPTQQFAHPAAVMLLQPSGRVARYLYGLELTPNDVRIGLLEAADGATVVSPVERALLFCFRWDRHESRYVLAAWNVMRAGGVLTMILLGGALFFYWRRERRRDAAGAASASTDSPTLPLGAPLPAIASATSTRGSEVHDG